MPHKMLVQTVRLGFRDPSTPTVRSSRPFGHFLAALGQDVFGSALPSVADRPRSGHGRAHIDPVAGLVHQGRHQVLSDRDWS